MLPSEERHRSLKRRPGLWLGLALAALLLTALPTPGAPFGADPEAAAALLEELDERYEVLTLSDRYVLQPTGPEVGFRSIEVTAGSVAVDGESTDRSELEELVGDDAGIIFAISELGSAEWSATEELRRRIERLAEERRLEPEDLEEIVRTRVEELESLEEEHLEAIEEALEEQRRDERRRSRRRGRVRTDTRVSFGSSLTIEDNETSHDVVVLGGSLDVEGKVRGDAVFVAGSAEIRGEVSGTVTAIGGSISLGPGARIDGDAISIGGAVHRDPTADIYGEITEVSMAPAFELDDLWDGLWIPHWHLGWFDFGVGELFVRVGKTVVLAVLLLVLTLLFPRLIAAVAERAEREPWKSGIVGLGAQLLFLFALPVICVILVVTIIGIPLALLLAPLATFALVVLFLLGLTGVAMAGGRLLRARFSWQSASPYLLVVLGLVLIQGWSILGEALGFVGGPIRFFAWLLLLVGFLIKYVAWTMGLGAILLHYFSPLPSAAVPAAAAAGGLGTAPPPPAPLAEPADRYDRYAGTQSPAEPPPPPPPEPEEPEVVDPDEEYRRAGAGETPSAETEAEGPDAEEADAEEPDPEAEEANEGSDRP